MEFNLNFFNHCLFIFLMIPCFSSSCFHTLPCNNSIEINPPFFFSNETNLTSCNSKIKTSCVDNIPMVYPFNHTEEQDYNTHHGYKLESISYENNTLIFQDPDLAHFLINSSCSSYSFDFSMTIEFTYAEYADLNKTISSFKCGSANQNPSPQKNISYEILRPGCSSPENASFEWSLSFNIVSGDLYFSAARYSTVSFLPECSSQATRGNKIIVVSIIAGALAFILACSILIIKLQVLRNFLWKHKTQESIEISLEKYGSLAPKKYKYAALKKITNSFGDKLGKGGFGTVYKGIQQDGSLVAVKFLHNYTSNGEEFINEVISINRTSHVNVVKLLGFCIEGSKQALVYEYMPNGSLDKYIYTDDPKINLGLEKLYEIAIGIARGLEYLHLGCNTHIVHFDIKPQNILLDEDFCPKIADFGLAKLCMPKESIISMSDMRGTIGFIAPEVFSRSVGVVSTKSDVYSFGMLILEIVRGRKNFKMDVQNSGDVYFPHWIYDRIVQNDEIEICDLTNETEKIARKMVLIGLWCAQMNPTNRPSISKVLEMFEKNLDDLKMPPKPYFNSSPRSMISSSSDSYSENSHQNLVST